MGKTLQELTISDNFMFGAVMTLPDNCRRMLELSLDIPVGSVEINTEKSFLYHPEYKGVRLDVYAKDENNTHYDVEMQVAKKEALAKRTRYYHSQMDMELLVKGKDYSELPKVCVIFICDFDPFEEKKYRYTFQGRCDEKEELLLGDERFTIFLSTKGENRDEVSQELIAFLDYVKANLAESTQDFNDNYVRQLQDSVKQVKMSREMGVRYMQLQELLRDERAEGIAIGRAEGRAEGKVEGRREELAKNILFTLGKRGMNPDGSLRKSIASEYDLEFLNKLMDAAFEVKSLEEFVQKMR